jgi:hypothetical protein
VEAILIGDYAHYIMRPADLSSFLAHVLSKYNNFLGAVAKPVDDHQMVVLIAKAPSNGAGVRQQWQPGFTGL